MANGPSGGNCYGTTTVVSTNNLSIDGTCSSDFTQVTPIQLALGVLIGSPAYYPLLAGSAAMDAGMNNGCPATDRRGQSRPQDGDGNGSAICDVGSYEYKSFVPTDFLYLPLIQR